MLGRSCCSADLLRQLLCPQTADGELDSPDGELDSPDGGQLHTTVTIKSQRQWMLLECARRRAFVVWRIHVAARRAARETHGPRLHVQCSVVLSQLVSLVPDSA